MTEQLHCTHTRPDGTACRGPAMKGAAFCYWHNPATEEERATGFRGPRPESEPGPPLFPEEVPLETADDIQRLLGRVANYLATAPRPDTERAAGLSRVAAVLLRAVRLRELQGQVAGLTTELEDARRQNADLTRQLTYARDDIERYRRTLAEMREKLSSRSP